jgi:hypothetical protein
MVVHNIALTLRDIARMIRLFVSSAVDNHGEKEVSGMGENTLRFSKYTPSKEPWELHHFSAMTCHQPLSREFLE